MSARLRKAKQSKSLYQELAALNPSRTERAIIDLMKLPTKLSERLIKSMHSDRIGTFEGFKHHLSDVLANCNLMASDESISLTWDAMKQADADLYAEFPGLD